MVLSALSTEVIFVDTMSQNWKIRNSALLNTQYVTLNGMNVIVMDMFSNDSLLLVRNQPLVLGKIESLTVDIFYSGNIDEIKFRFRGWMTDELIDLTGVTLVSTNRSYNRATIKLADLRVGETLQAIEIQRIDTGNQQHKIHFGNIRLVEVPVVTKIIIVEEIELPIATSTSEVLPPTVTPLPSNLEESGSNMVMLAGLFVVVMGLLL